MKPKQPHNFVEDDIIATNKIQEETEKDIIEEVLDEEQEFKPEIENLIRRLLQKVLQSQKQKIIEEIKNMLEIDKFSKWGCDSYQVFAEELLKTLGEKQWQ